MEIEVLAEKLDRLEDLMNRAYLSSKEALSLKEACEVFASAVAYDPHVGLGMQEGQGVDEHDDPGLAGQGGPRDHGGLKVECDELRREVGYGDKDEV